MAESAGAIAEMVAAGKARYAGASNCNLQQIQQFHAACPLTAVQLPYNMLQRDIEELTIPWCRENGVGVVTYWDADEGNCWPAGSTRQQGVAEGDNRSKYPMYQGDEWQKNQRFVDRLRKVADRTGRTVAQVGGQLERSANRRSPPCCAGRSAVGRSRKPAPPWAGRSGPKSSPRSTPPSRIAAKRPLSGTSAKGHQRERPLRDRPRARWLSRNRPRRGLPGPHWRSVFWTHHAAVWLSPGRGPPCLASTVAEAFHEFFRRDEPRRDLQHFTGRRDQQRRGEAPHA